jgi:hypothetical protein
MNPKPRFRSWCRRLLLGSLVLVLVLAVLLGARGLYAFRDRHPGYALRLNLDSAKARQEPRGLRAGFGRARITPELSDPRRPVWLAGFSQHRAATNIHDDLWAMACVLEDGHTRLGIVVLDAIGFFHDDVIEVRRRIPADWKVDYTVICSTHNHSTPDLMGLWGPSFFRTGVDLRYRQQVMAGAIQALGEAVTNLQPALLALHEITTAPEGLVADTRKPTVYDADLRVMHFTDPTRGATLGSLVGWADHPETVWGRNQEVTADFCGVLRDGLEQGVVVDGKRLAAGLGGTHLFVNGAVGGLMSTTPSVTVRDPYLDKDFKAPSHEKARALGRQLLWRVLSRLAHSTAIAVSNAPISIRARTLELPLENAAFLAAPILGLLDRGHVRWKTLRTEVALITLGEASIACLPGEVYPEIVNGGIERAPGGDFDLDPMEVPPLRSLMPGRVKFVFGLANDEIGYIIPKSEWDRKPPYLYGSKRGVYGEINSVGPNTAPLLHAAMAELCREARR